MKEIRFKLAFVLITMSFVSACASVTPVPTAIPTPDARATETRIAANIFATQTASAPTLTKTPADTATPLPTNTSTVTLTPSPTNTSTPTSTPLPTNTPRPLPTAVPFVKGGLKYSAPQITTQQTNPTLYPGDIVLTWSFQETLEDDEWFEVRGWKEGKNERNSLAWVKEKSYLFRVRFGSIPDWVSGLGQYYLSVRVIKGQNGKWQADLSDESVPPFKWHW